MSTSTSRLAYADCLDLFQRALGDPRGIRVKFADYGTAWRFRLRLNAARKIDRDENAETFDADHPMHGRSEFDGMVAIIELITNKDQPCWLKIEKLSADFLSIESLSGEGNGIGESVEGDRGEPAGEAEDTEEEAASSPYLDTELVPIRRR